MDVGESKDYFNIASSNDTIKYNVAIVSPARGGDLVYNKPQKGPIGTITCALGEKETKSEKIYMLSTSRVISANGASKRGSIISQKAGLAQTDEEKDIATQEGRSLLTLTNAGEPPKLNLIDADVGYVETTRVVQPKSGFKENGDNLDFRPFKEEKDLKVTSGLISNHVITFSKNLPETLKSKLYISSRGSGSRSGTMSGITTSCRIPVGNKEAHFRSQYLIKMPGVQPCDYGALVFGLPSGGAGLRAFAVGMLIGHLGAVSEGMAIVTPIEVVLKELNLFIYYYMDKFPL